MLDCSGAHNLSAAPVTVVFGADGFIGARLLAGLQVCNPASFGVGRRPGPGRLILDFAAPDIRPLTLPLRGVTHAVIAAGVSRIAACEREPARTREINVAGTVELARQLVREGIRVVALSSDYVFDGHTGYYDDRSPVNPLNEYGRQKVAMEEGLLATGGGSPLIVRLSKVFDLQRGSGTLLDEMAAKLTRGEPYQAAQDQVFCPTLVDDLVSGLQSLLASARTGIVHFCAPTRISRFRLAANLAAAFGCETQLVQKIALRDLNEPFIRPLDTSMLCSSFTELSLPAFAPLDTCIARLKNTYGSLEGT